MHAQTAPLPVYILDAEQQYSSHSRVVINRSVVTYDNFIFSWKVRSCDGCMYTFIQPDHSKAHHGGV